MKEIVTISNLQAGRHGAYEALFEEWYVPLCNYAYSILRDGDDAKDIVQQAFCKLWDRREELEIRTSIKSYLYRIVHNDCLNKIKQQRLHQEHEDYIAYDTSVSVNNTDNVVIGNELQVRINAAIDRLPPRCREVFVLSRMQQKPYAEIAAELNISTNTVETQIVKALRTLRQELKDYLPVLLVILAY